MAGSMRRVSYKGFILESAEDLYENAPCGYLSFLPDGTIVKINKTLLNWLGYERTEVLYQKKFIDFLAIGGKIFYETHLAPLLKLQGFAHEINFDLIPRHKVPVPVLINTIQVRNENGEPQINRSTLFNITDRKKYEQELLLAKKKAEAANKVKADFIATVSHEIRTPLNAVIGVTDLLLQTQPSPQQLEYLHILKTASDGLLHLINDILDLSKIEAGRASLNPRLFHLPDFVNNLLYRFSLKAENKGLGLESFMDAKIPEKVIADEVKLGQVLTNLLGNAIKFTEAGSVKLSLIYRGLENNDALVQFKITDTGIGIPEDKLTEIFEEFTQASGKTEQQYGGTGLGLTITKRILNLFNTTIQVESKVGQGTEFSFDLKLAIPESVAKPASQPPAAVPEHLSLNGIKVLLAEDNNINVLITEKYLTTWGAETEVARNGLQAITKIKEQNFDLVLMDLEMPVMDGYQATKYIRNLPGKAYQQLPIIALSASAKYDLVQKMEECGLTDFVDKPFKPADLLHKLITYSQKGK